MSGPLPKGNALLHRSGHGPGKFRFVVGKGIITRRDGGVDAGLQIPKLAQLADDAPADFLDDLFNVAIRGWRTLDKPWLETLLGAVNIDTLQKNYMEMEMQIERPPKR